MNILPVVDTIRFEISGPDHFFPSRREMYYGLAYILERKSSRDYNFYKEERKRVLTENMIEGFDLDYVDSFLKPRGFPLMRLEYEKILRENDELQNYLTNDKVKSIRSFVDRVLLHLE